MKNQYRTKIQTTLKKTLALGLCIASSGLLINTADDYINFKKYSQLATKNSNEITTHHQRYDPIISTHQLNTHNQETNNADLSKYYGIRSVTGAAGAASGIYLSLSLSGFATRKEDKELEEILE